MWTGVRVNGVQQKGGGKMRAAGCCERVNTAVNCTTMLQARFGEGGRGFWDQAQLRSPGLNKRKDARV